MTLILFFHLQTSEIIQNYSELIPCLLCSLFSREIFKLAVVQSIPSIARQRVMLGASQVRHIAPEALVVSLDIALSYIV